MVAPGYKVFFFIGQIEGKPVTSSKVSASSAPVSAEPDVLRCMGGIGNVMKLECINKHSSHLLFNAFLLFTIIFF